MTEQQLHTAVAKYLALALDCPWTTFPAGGGGRVRGNNLRHMGLEAGWPDIQILHHGRYHGIELKNERGVVSDKQKDIHERIRASGGRVAVCRSQAEVEGVLAGWDIPMKARGA